MVGELRYLWQRGLVEGRLCGCGQPVPQCEFWRRVLDSTGGTPTTRMVELLHGLERSDEVLQAFRRHPVARASLREAADELGRLYGAIAKTSGARIIVDSSKPPTWGHLIRMTHAVDLYVLHIVRDPRACAFSQQRLKIAADRPDGALMRRQPPWKAALTWDLWNLAADHLAREDPSRYLQVRYEDLAAAPHEWLAKIGDLVGLGDERSTADASGGGVELPVSHTVAGNPIRLDRRVIVRPDTEWTTEMRPRDRRTVEILTAPVALRYRYRPTTTLGASRVPPGRGVVVEIAGLPGAGKSLLADAVMVRLEGQGIAVSDATAGFGPTSSGLGRLTRKALMVARTLAVRPSMRAVAKAAIGTRQGTVHDWLARPANVVLSAVLTDRAQQVPVVTLLDQGITQDSWSLALRADRERSLASLDRLLSLATLPDVIVFVEAPQATLVERLRARASQHSRLQRQSDDEMSVELVHGAELFEEILNSLAQLPADNRPTVLRVDGTRPIAADDVVALIRSELARLAESA